MKKLIYLMICFALLFSGCKQSVKKENCPMLEVSENKRTLTAGGEPFFWLGDTGWLLLSKLSRSDAEKYLQDRKDKGFNVIQIKDFTWHLYPFGDRM